jgi:predicted Fe-Mo cluster-binding NifX family protein
MKIAVITDDGKTISRHFGRARYYQVIEIDDGKIIGREMRDKMGHVQFTQEEHQPHDDSLGHGMGDASHNKHQMMSQAISDCEALICGGMGRGAYQSMEVFGIKPVVTQISDLEEAVNAYLKGELKDQTDMLH